LARALAGAECVIDAASGSARGRRRLAPEAAVEFFAASARNRHEIGQKAGVRRMVEGGRQPAAGPTFEAWLASGDAP